MQGESRRRKPEALRTLEERVLLMTSIAVALVVTPILMFILVDVVAHSRFKPGIGALFAAHIGLMCLLFLSKNVRLRALLLVLYLMAAATMGLLHYGPAMAVGMAFLAAALLANIYLGVRATWIVLGVSFCALGTIAALFVSGDVPFYSPSLNDLRSPANWLRICLFTMVTLVSVILVFGMLLRRLEHVAFEAQSALDNIERERDERRNAELAFISAQRHEIMGRMASGAAHDLNNILTAVKGAADMATLESRDAEDIGDDLAIIKEGVMRATVLTRQLLSFGKQRAPDRRHADLSRIVFGLQGIVERLLPPDVELSLRVAPELPSILADPSQIEQIVLNLCVNARDALPNGGKLEVTTSFEKIDDADRVVLCVRDSGTGIPEDVQARMFEPFFTTKPEGKGTGLGLATVRILAEAHAAKVSCTSALDRGTTMTVSFPTADDSARKQWALPISTPAAALIGGRESILVCDSDAMSRKAAARILDDAGYRVEAVANSDGAINALAKSHFALAILDATAPGGLAGADLDVALMRADPSLRVLHTTGLDPSSLDYAPPRTILTKPFGRADLLVAVRRVLDADARPN